MFLMIFLKQSNSLKAHRLIHTGDKPVFQCELCPTTCGRKTDLRLHVQKLHTAVQPVHCKMCGKAFPDRYTLKVNLLQNWQFHLFFQCMNYIHSKHISSMNRYIRKHTKVKDASSVTYVHTVLFHSVIWSPTCWYIPVSVIFIKL